LCWARRRGGCWLVATACGLWEWPDGGTPQRHCWCTIDEVRYSAGVLTVRPRPPQEPLRAELLETDSGLAELVRIMEAGSRLVELAFRLPSGSRLQVTARTCRFEGSLVWSTRLDEAAGADPAADANLARALLARARQEYGAIGGDGTGQLAPAGRAGIPTDAVVPS